MWKPPNVGQPLLSTYEGTMIAISYTVVQQEESHFLNQEHVPKSKVIPFPLLSRTRKRCGGGGRGRSYGKRLQLLIGGLGWSSPLLSGLRIL